MAMESFRIDTNVNDGDGEFWNQRNIRYDSNCSGNEM